MSHRGGLSSKTLLITLPYCEAIHEQMPARGFSRSGFKSACVRLWAYVHRLRASGWCLEHKQSAYLANAFHANTIYG